MPRPQRGAGAGQLTPLRLFGQGSKHPAVNCPQMWLINWPNWILNFPKVRHFPFLTAFKNISCFIWSKYTLIYFHQLCHLWSSNVCHALDVSLYTYCLHLYFVNSLYKSIVTVHTCYFYSFCYSLQISSYFLTKEASKILCRICIKKRE